MGSRFLGMLIAAINVLLFVSSWYIYALSGWIIVTDNPQPQDARLTAAAWIAVFWVLWAVLNLVVSRYLRERGVTSGWTYLLPIGAVYSVGMLALNFMTAVG